MSGSGVPGPGIPGFSASAPGAPTPGFPWLPIGTPLPGGAPLARLLDSGPAWQLCATAGSSRVALLLKPNAAPGWWTEELAALSAALPRPMADAGGHPCLVLPAAARPVTLPGLALRSPAVGRAEAEALGRALAALQARRPGAAWSSALFLPDPGFALATEDDPADDHRATLVAALSGGVRDGTLPAARIAEINPRLDPDIIGKLLATAGSPSPRRAGPDATGFHLPGQPRLQALLRDRVLDVLHRPAAYARMGVPFPGGVLLAGPPGCGKSFAAGRIAAFLGWPLHEVQASSVGSMWLHETSRRMADAFDAAAAEAPAVVLLEELDALGRSRSDGNAPTAEEVNTLLRLVEAAPARSLLVIGTTNRPDAIDPALRRRGRFDLVETMDFPDESGIAETLRALLQDRPHAPSLDVQRAARSLARRPVSDAVWVVNEAARLAVRNGHEMIDDLVLARAVQALS